jgi:glyoxylase-like metal-dependent hydrolase (beta-lactamase superfamily II)
MEALGVHPHEVDFVMCTHLHVDHVGTEHSTGRRKRVPTLPRARYLMGRMEYEHWGEAARAAPGTRDQPAVHSPTPVLPVVATGQAEFVSTDHCVFDDREATLRFVPAPGHTIGNMMMIDLRGKPRSRCHVRRCDPSSRSSAQHHGCRTRQTSTARPH